VFVIGLGTGTGPVAARDRFRWSLGPVLRIVPFDDIRAVELSSKNKASRRPSKVRSR
jgi:hypothetical protein